MRKHFKIQTKFLVAIISVGNLLACGQVNQNTTKPSISSSTSIPSTTQPSVSSSPTTVPSPTVTEPSMTVAEMAKLKPEQVQELMFLSQQAEQKQPGRRFRIIAPAYIPSGFQLDSVKTDLRVGIGSYNINYRSSSSGACFSVNASSGGWGAGPAKLQNTKVFSEALGILVLSIETPDKASDHPKVYLKDSPIIRDARGYGFSSGWGQGCTNMDFSEAVKVVQSLQYIDSPTTKAKPLAEIQRDADRLIAKFDFPLNSCGDLPSKSNESWYPVFIDGTFNSGVKSQYCKDSIIKGKAQNNFEQVQVGSFTSYERALEFAKAVGGRVGKPDS